MILKSIANISKIKKILKWHPKIKFNNGINDMIKKIFQDY